MILLYKSSILFTTLSLLLAAVPKKGSVFCFELCGQIIKIYGDNFKFVPYERARIKYKTKSVVDP